MICKYVFRYCFLSVLLTGLFACGQDGAVDPAYALEVRQWRQERVSELMSANSWLALAGLFWLEPGDNYFGSHSGNALVFPAGTPDTLGFFRLEGDSVVMQLLGGHTATVNGRELSIYTLTAAAEPPFIQFQNLSWILLQRTDKHGIRLWDSQHPNLADTIHIDHYPVDPAWRIPAVLTPADSGYTVRIRNVLDMEMDMATEGLLRFEHDGDSYELIALDGGPSELFLIFADATTGETTYPGGRYLYAARPDSTGHTWLDFNKAYNPPCAFTDFATCLLPPAENRLELAITAGELNYGTGH